MHSPPLALTIAGSDSSAGAGIQADLKTFSAKGVYGLTAVSCVVAETPKVVSDIFPVSPLVLQKQISLLLKTYPIGAIKTGMLYSKAHIYAVCEILEETNIPLIIDPVMVATSGDSLLEDDAVHAIRHRLCPLATVITPNLPEAGVILKRKVTSEHEQLTAAQDLAKRYNCACYLKGGHLEGSKEHRDVLATPTKVEDFFAPHLELEFTHGTGCTLAAALTAGLAKGDSLSEAAKSAHEFTHQALKNSHTWDGLSHLDQVQLSRK